MPFRCVSLFYILLKHWLLHQDGSMRRLLYISGHLPNVTLRHSDHVPCPADEALLLSPAKPLDATGQLGSSASMPGNFGQGSGTSLCTPAQKRMCPHSSWNSSPQVCWLFMLLLEH